LLVDEEKQTVTVPSTSGWMKLPAETAFDGAIVALRHCLLPSLRRWGVLDQRMDERTSRERGVIWTTGKI
jgi:hypothetical protein